MNAAHAADAAAGAPRSLWGEQRSPVKGWHAVALAPIAPGTLLLSEEPLCFVAASGLPLCCACLQPTRRTCTACGVLLCERCAVAGGGPHDAAECGVVQEHSPPPPILLAFRGARSLRRSSRELQAVVDALLSHREGHTAEAVRRTDADAELLCSVLESAGEVGHSAERLSRLLMQFEVNCYGIAPRFVSVGEGVYPRAAVFNHSCRPNAMAVFDGVRLRVHTIEHVAPGTELCITYCFVGQTKARRRRELRDGHYFDCGCTRCRALPDRPGVELLVAACGGGRAAPPGVCVLRAEEVLLARGFDPETGEEVVDADLLAPGPGGMAELAALPEQPSERAAGAAEGASGIPGAAELSATPPWTLKRMAEAHGLSGLATKQDYVAALSALAASAAPPPLTAQQRVRTAVRACASELQAAKQRRSPAAAAAAAARAAQLAPPPSLLVTMAAHDAALLHHAAGDPAGAVPSHELSLPGFLLAMPRGYPPLGIKMQLYAEALLAAAREAEARAAAAEALRSLLLVYPASSDVLGFIRRAFPELLPA
eukprot:TRINITY_DN8004_c2_g1_i1.p1 TRINITY_DN8004_c2_g1~~TRINITY_DN8004_c2_g1_i1.p1  ORF type:complete len:541 (+),score=128.17 TRINITY_DN8004_c2_g1_i1:73-1695(+)